VVGLIDRNIVFFKRMGWDEMGNALDISLSGFLYIFWGDATCITALIVAMITTVFQFGSGVSFLSFSFSYFPLALFLLA